MSPLRAKSWRDCERGTTLKVNGRWSRFSAGKLRQLEGLRRKPYADKTFGWPDQAWRYPDPYVHNLFNAPFVGRYKDDPRFAAFCRKVGLPVPAELPST